ncbi:MAG: PAS domain-containing sensor histidine kinase, partial [candidate division Zixibacteria bacterium]|nr:PAS domain-containing sensor histidine kinase [candidate division Zixibacteria bacterium]
ELVDFSNPNRYQTEKVDLRKLVERAAELIRPDMKKTGIEFDVNYDDADWEVAVNKNQIMETILNLLINAVDAMPDGGKLEVRGFIERPDHKKEDYLTLRISDTGVGIKKEDIAKVFDRYYTTKKTGIGLGLAVVERIMSAHGGTLTVTSTEGKGAIFSLYFPIST